MNNRLKILLGLGLAAATLPVAAQRSIDIFEGTRTVPFFNGPTNITGGTAYAISPVIDIRGTDGAAKIDLNYATNVSTATAAVVAAVQISPDMTNWNSISNFAVITAPTAQYTSNYTWTVSSLGTGASGTDVTGGVLGCTNYVMLPGTATAPNAWQSGFATPYLAPLGYTNGASSITLTANTPEQIGLLIDQLPRAATSAGGWQPSPANVYMRVVVTNANTSGNNITFNAALTTAVRKY